MFGLADGVYTHVFEKSTLGRYRRGNTMTNVLIPKPRRRRGRYKQGDRGAKESAMSRMGRKEPKARHAARTATTRGRDLQDHWYVNAKCNNTGVVDEVTHVEEEEIYSEWAYVFGKFFGSSERNKACLGLQHHSQGRRPAGRSRFRWDFGT